MDQNAPISHPVAKIISLWAIIGISSWTEAAGFVGFVYSLILIGEWAWRRIGRPFARRHGWIAPTPTESELGKLR